MNPGKDWCEMSIIVADEFFKTIGVSISLGMSVTVHKVVLDDSTLQVCDDCVRVLDDSLQV